jgi:hypothetical protein
MTASLTYLEGADTQLKQDLIRGGDANGEGSKHHVVDTKQRDEQQCGLGEPPGRRRGMRWAAPWAPTRVAEAGCGG